MADTKISALAAVTTLHTNDLLVLVDVSDTTMATTGTNKKLTPVQLTGALTGDVTYSGFAGTIAPAAVTYSKMQNVAASRLIGNPTGSPAPHAEIALGTNLSFAGSTLNAAGSPVTSVFTRAGAVVAATGDYSVAQVTGAAPLASPALTGTPTAPTPVPADNSTTLATTAFVQAHVATPAGLDQQVQYNSGGAFGGHAGLTYASGTGTLTATNLAGAGAAITALNASNLTTGTTPVARLPLLVASGASHAAGIVPDPGATAGTARYLREDASWAGPLAAAPKFNLAYVADPGLPAAGDIWASIETNDLSFSRNSGCIQRLGGPVLTTNWGNLISNTTAPTSVFNGTSLIFGSRIFPANSLARGVLTFSFIGALGTAATGPNLTIVASLGGTTVASGTASLPGSMSNGMILIPTGVFVMRLASGSLYIDAFFVAQFADGTGTHLGSLYGRCAGGNTVGPFNQGTSLTFDLTVQFSAASASNQIQPVASVISLY